MGFEDRQYTREESMFGGNRTGLAQFSIVVILIAINVIVWLANAFVPGVNDLLRLDVSQPWRIWTFLTYGFTHSPIQENPLHILFNMFILFIFGRPVSERLGRYEFLRFYLLAIVAGGLGYFIWCLFAGKSNPVVGASGATTAVLILFILWYPHQKLFLMGLIEIPAWILGVAVIVYDLLGAFNPKSSVAWQAHIAGAGFAFLYFQNQWNFKWLGNLTQQMVPKKKSKLGVYNPDDKPDRDDRLREEGDRILAKISKQGEESLTRKERKTLERYSKSIRNRQ
jgi:membrane associated rhomboid family serine protease